MGWRKRDKVILNVYYPRGRADCQLHTTIIGRFSTCPFDVQERNQYKLAYIEGECVSSQNRFLK